MINNKKFALLKKINNFNFFWKDIYYFLFLNKIKFLSIFSKLTTNLILKKLTLAVIPYYLIIDLLLYFNLHIPHFCFEKELSISGNCRMCLIEIEKNLKPISSCTFNYFSNIKLFYWLPSLQKARENILEFLLENHPLDCPICDQGGECDLQDLTLNWSTHKSRFFFLKKKTFKNFFLSQLIETSMNKCIQCTRCVRFLTEILEKKTLGILFRSLFSEINFFWSKILFNKKYYYFFFNKNILLKKIWNTYFFLQLRNEIMIDLIILYNYAL